MTNDKAKCQRDTILEFRRLDLNYFLILVFVLLGAQMRWASRSPGAMARARFSESEIFEEEAMTRQDWDCTARRIAEGFFTGSS